MNRFIKLTNMVINTNAISCISLTENAFYISLVSSNFSGMIIAASGHVSSDKEIIKVSNSNNSKDYQIIKTWVDSI